MTATWTNSRQTGVSHVGDTSEAMSYSKMKKLNKAKSLIVTMRVRTESCMAGMADIGKS